MVVAILTASTVAVSGAVESPTVGISRLGLSIRLDALSTIMLTMIALLAVVILRNSVKYLAVLVAAWIGTSLGLHGLLVSYPERRLAVIAACKKFPLTRMGEAFLVLGAALLFQKFGTGNLETIFTAAREAGGGWLVLRRSRSSGRVPVHRRPAEVGQLPHPWLTD